MPGDPKTVGTLLAWARQSLDSTGTPNAAQEALWLLAFALEMEHHALVSRTEQVVTAEQLARAKTLVSRRMAREPLQYILRTQEFCGLDFAVTSSVLIPRPETELLVHAVLKEGGLAEGATLVDVGTGSGCIAVTLATILDEARIFAVDCSAEALVVAKSNAARHGVGEKIVWIEGNLLSPLRDRITVGTVDVIVSNPPYIADGEWERLQPEVKLFEPRLALLAGPRGTEFHEQLFHDSKEFLVPDGLLVMEIGQGQLPLVRQAAEQAGGYTGLQTVKDEAGIDRVIIARRAG
ncbi:MAG: Release factor glutamine methyltransferase [Candidatus Nitrospira kreftii]|uniref:Release factor glutamine methyltransferase n=1 Tax=Candidatus Nitrospira kreftii TaxID=2652173 RepID=A0A7S8FHF5_9BACT|nr:MAG: Release factor glutamine methyltransferase [Candidatus Nitrospira kreftii]